MICPRHNKPANEVRKDYWKCAKCFAPIWCAPYVVPTEYDACRKIEAPYRRMEFNVPFFGNKQIFFSLLTKICNSWSLPIPRLQETRAEHSDFKGVYVSRLDKNPGRYGLIELKPSAGIVTLIHELTHHFIHLEKLNPKDSGSNLHGGDFLWVEELLLKDFVYGL